MDTTSEGVLTENSLVSSETGKDGRTIHPNSLANLKKWEPGQSGNPTGHHKPGPQLARLAREFLAGTNPKTGITRAKEFVEKIVTDAFNGDPVARKLVWNYVEGMPKENAEIIVRTEVDLGVEYLRGIIEERRQKIHGDERPALSSVSDQREADTTDSGTE